MGESVALELSAVEPAGFEISGPTSVVVEEDDDTVLLFETVCSPKPESEVDALFSSLDSESGKFGRELLKTMLCMGDVIEMHKE